MKINPRTITYISAVAEEHSFSKAAEKLYITQPSLSQHILNAEREYGVQFFDRRSVPVSLTYAGERFVAIAREGLGCTFVIDHELRLPEDMTAWKIAGAAETYQMYLVYRQDAYLSRPFRYFIDLAGQLDRRDNA